MQEIETLRKKYSASANFFFTRYKEEKDNKKKQNYKTIWVANTDREIAICQVQKILKTGVI